jgi:hypothetical protein
MVPCLYLNENADLEIRRILEIEFPDVPRVSADYIQKLTGGMAEGPPIADYAAVIIDENGEINLIASDITQLL